LGPQAGDDVFYREPELLDREVAGVAQADERAAAADELFKPLQIARRQLIAVFRPDRAVAPSSPAAGLRAGHRHARIVGDDHDVDLVAERRLEVLGMNGNQWKAVLLEHPARPAFVHAAGPRLIQPDARPADA